MVKQDLACYYQLLHEKSKARKQLNMDGFLKKSWAADPPNTSSDILPSTSMAINAKRNIADFFNQLNSLLYHRNHLLHQRHDYNDPPMVESPQPSPHTAQ
jgi:hypothetical protein